MNPSGIVVRTWNDAPISRRDSDGFADATAMCQANGKLWGNYRQLDRTADYIKALAASTGLAPDELVITTTTGPNHLRGTWIHPRLAVDLARWLSPDFAVWMDGWFLEQAQAPQVAAPGITAQDAAQIAAEVFRRITSAATTRRTYRTTRRLPQSSPAELHLELMRKVHTIAERTRGTIGWRDLHHMLSPLQRSTADPDTYLAAARDLEALGAGVVSFGARGAVQYTATGMFPAPID
jgi:hypothetical protein